MKSIAIHQSQYIPWPPYFKKIASADIFVVLDKVQYQKNGVQNRNSIRNREKAYFLTIPVTGHLEDLISDKKIADSKWNRKHWTSLKTDYVKAPRWQDHNGALEKLYSSEYGALGGVNKAFLEFMLQELGVRTEIHYQSEFSFTETKSELVLAICRHFNADTYISGTGSKAYLDEAGFARAGIKIDYRASMPPVYEQFQGGFVSGLSMIDMMLNLSRADIKSYLENK
jgi:hypothetical protein